MENYKIPLINKEVVDYKGTRRVYAAPILDQTDRRFRHMARQITENAWLYGEVINAGVIIYDNKSRFLMSNEGEQPVALQLNGSGPADLAKAAKTTGEYGYNEISPNYGCPSPHVQKGAFGVCLVDEVGLVTDCLDAMQDAVDIPATIKHRIGVSRQAEYGIATEFIDTLYERTACRTFIVHARDAWLDGLSPKENREMPPLKYGYVYRLKQDFPEFETIISGRITTSEQISERLRYVDDIMVDHEAYHSPTVMRDWDRLLYGESSPPVEYADLVPKLYEYSRTQIQAGRDAILRHVIRYNLGLVHGLRDTRTWRHAFSDAALLKNNDGSLILDAWREVGKANVWEQGKWFSNGLFRLEAV